MNKQRRNEVSRAVALLDEAKSILEACGEAEQDYLDNMPDSFRYGEKGSVAEEAISAFEEAISSVEDAMSALEPLAE